MDRIFLSDTFKRSKICLVLFLMVVAFGVADTHINNVFAQPDDPAAVDGDDTGAEDCITTQFDNHEEWLVTTFAGEYVIPTLQSFAEQMSAVAMHQTMSIGKFFDAKHQLETQRLFQELQLQAHKDYQPSRSFCAIGTNTRSLAHSEQIAKYNAYALGKRQMARHLGTRNTTGAAGEETDKISRWELFTDHYCDKQDNGWIAGNADSGLQTVCNSPITTTSDEVKRINLDIDYTRLVQNRRSLDVFRPADAKTADETDIQSLSANLYGHNVLTGAIAAADMAKGDKPKLYMSMRSVAAKRNVAEASFNAIVGMKSLGSANGAFDSANVKTHIYLGAVLKELGIPDDEVSEYLGLTSGTHSDNFSYYTQLEILSKKIFQNPDFYSNLYDKPANVKRMGAALTAIELMLDRAIFESQLRQEMNMSVLLSSKLRDEFDDIDKNLK